MHKRKTSPFVTSPVKSRQRDSLVMRDDAGIGTVPSLYDELRLKDFFPDESEAIPSYYYNDAPHPHPSSQPLPILRQRPSKSSISSHTPDMVPDLDPSISPQVLVFFALCFCFAKISATQISLLTCNTACREDAQCPTCAMKKLWCRLPQQPSSRSWDWKTAKCWRAEKWKFVTYQLEHIS